MNKKNIKKAVLKPSEDTKQYKASYDDYKDMQLETMVSEDLLGSEEHNRLGIAIKTAKGSLENLTKEMGYKPKKNAKFETLVKYATSLAKIIDDPSEKEETLNYIKRVEAEFYEHKNSLVNGNMRLVVSMAKNFANMYNLDVADLRQEGSIGLMSAAEKFDPDMGFQFSTYAMWWIKQTIMRYKDNNSGTVRIPVYKNDFIKKVKSTAYELEMKKGERPTISQIATKLKAKRGDVKDALLYDSLARNSVSLNSSPSEEGDAQLESFFMTKDSKINSEINEYDTKQATTYLVDELKKKFPDKNYANVITVRYGLKDGIVKTLEETAEFLHKNMKKPNGKDYPLLTRERVRQIEAAAIKKLKHPNNLEMLEDIKYTK